MADEILKEEQKATTGTRQVTNANDTINQIYDTQLQSQKDSLNAAMEKSLSEQQAAADKIAPQYQQSANDLATQYERNRMNFNAQALQSGINTGAGSQAELARNSEYQRDFGNLRTSEAEATATAERQMAQTKSDYQLQIQQAIANNDSKRAEALLTQYKEDQTKLENNAKTLASTGDFSGYYNYYTSQGYSAADAQKMVDNMRSYWIASNPKTAYGMGMISLDEYNRIANPGKTSGDGGYVKPTTDGTTYTPSKEVESYINSLDVVSKNLEGGTARAQQAVQQAVVNERLSKDDYNYIVSKMGW